MENRNVASDSDDLPEFFKVYIRHHSLHQMLIPREFLVYMGRRKSGSAELRGRCGRTWGVELVDDGKDFYFTDGWGAFVKDNLVRDGDFLFFKFHGNLTFSVVIYGENMCEKQIMFTDESSTESTDIFQNGGEQDGVQNATMRNVRPMLEGDKMEAQTDAISVKPSFEKRVRISQLVIPSSFLAENSLSYRSHEKMVLRTGRNSSWEVNIIKSRKVTLSGGWRVFARENCLRVRNICKFELLGRLEMMVHFVSRKKVSKRKR